MWAKVSENQTHYPAPAPYTEEETGVPSGQYERREAQRWRSTAQPVLLAGQRALLVA